MESRSLPTWPGPSPQDEPDAGAPASDPAAFDLGEIKGSRDFYFILRNPGATSVTGVTIGSSDPAFPVTPASISVVDPDAFASLVPVVRTTATHGTTLGGVGWQPILSPGAHSWTLTLTGQTTDPDTGDAIQLAASAQLSVAALVFDIEAYDGPTLMDLANASVMIGDDPAFDISASFPTIKNTGNVPILVRSMANPPTQPALMEATIGPGESTTESQVSSSCPNSAPQACFHLQIEGSNTVADTERLPVKADGSISVYFMHN